MSPSIRGGAGSHERALGVSNGAVPSEGTYDGYRQYTDVAEVSSQAETREAVGDIAARIVIIKRGRPRTVLFRCPCGCGEIVVINVDPRTGKAWRLRRSMDGVTLLPSVWRTTGCRSHFVLWENRVWWCRLDDENDGGEWPLEVKQALRDGRRGPAPD